MAIIAQKSLFVWEEIEGLGDLERLRIVLANIPDEKLMQKLESQRGNGRNDYPIRAMWNSLMAGIVFQHASIESLRRELWRNGQLRWLCGFYDGVVPPAWAYTRFLKKLMSFDEEIKEIFAALVEELSSNLPGFGKNLVVDGKGIRSHGRPKEKGKNVKADGRRDLDANIGKKVYHGERKDGSLWEKTVSWFGYKLHLIVDADYELPVAYKITRASAAEVPEANKLIDQLAKEHPNIIDRCEHFLGDRGYDDGKLIKKLWDEYKIKPIIDIRNMWKDQETRLVKNRSNVVYDYKGRVYCYCPQQGIKREMAYAGFEKDRQALKYRCPSEHYGLECKGKANCRIKGCTRITLSEERRVFTPVARSSYRWENLYKKRTAVERVNSRLDVSFGFERHFIRGQKKMELRCDLALIVMLTMAVGWVKEKKPDKIRSLVKSA